MSADLYFTRLSSSFFFLFFRQLISELANGTQPYLATWSEVSVIWKCMYEIWGIPSPTNQGHKNPPFWTTSQLNGNFNSLYLPKQTWYRQSVKCVDNYEGSATSSQNDMNFGPQTASIGSEFSPTLRKICIPLHCQALQTEINKWNSVTLCQTVNGRSC